MDITRRTLLQTAAAAVAAKAAPSDRITVGMIGCGARAHELMGAVMKHPTAEIVAISDAYTGRIERASERIGTKPKVYSNYHELLAQKSIDAVVVATPDHLHRPMILEALAAGKDVYSEKPLTYRAAEGREIVEAVDRGKRILQVGSQPVSSNIQIKAREWIRSGKLGQITMIRAAYNRNTASGAWIYPIPPDASPKTVDWEAFLGPAPKRPFNLERFFRWRCYEDYSGGIATDLFVHLCTTIHFLMDAKMPSQVMAMGQLYRWKESREVPDNINAILEYPEGFAVTLGSTFSNQFGGESGFQVLGSKGAMVIGWDSVSFYPDTAREDNRWIVDSWPKPLEDAYYKDPKVIESELSPRQAAETLRHKSDGVESTYLHFGNFFSAVKSRQPVWENAMVGHRAAACAHMVNMSAKQKRMVEWDFAKDDIRG
jgi:predicted dehydrogenase